MWLPADQTQRFRFYAQAIICGGKKLKNAKPRIMKKCKANTKKFMDILPGGTLDDF